MDEMEEFEESVVGTSEGTPVVKIPKTELVAIDRLKLDGKNPNKMSDKQFEALKKNIEKFGFLIPIITNKDFLISDGEHRLKAAKELFFEQVPVIALPVEEVDRRILRQVMNKLHGEHDLKLDWAEFKFITDFGKLEDLTELIADGDKKLVQFLASVEKDGLNEDDLDISNSLKAPKYEIKLGDVWNLGEHKLVCGDSTDKQYVSLLMGEEKADMVFTDPPYNVNYGSLGITKFSLERAKVSGNMAKYQKLVEIKKRFPDGQIKGDNQTSEQWASFCLNLAEIIKENCINASYVCGAPGPDGDLMRLILSEVLGHWSATIIWNKKTMVLGRADYQRQYEPIWYGWQEGKNHYIIQDRTITDVWDVSKPIKNDLHLTMKPIELISKAITNSSKRENIVLDLFGGSGSTLIACEKLNRKCRMIEIDPIYCSVIIERWEKITGKKAEKVST